MLTIIDELTKTREQYWNEFVKNIKNPGPCKWAIPREDQQLSLVLIEGREHPFLQGVLYNAAHVYANTDVPLYIVHTSTNRNTIRHIIRDWENVQCIELPMDNIPLPEYNKLFTTPSFWEQFLSSHVLIFQTDTVLRRKIDDVYFKYPYVGAPWPKRWNICESNIGNGGFSLRSVSYMKHICIAHGQTDKPEDVHFSRKIPAHEAPPYELAMAFSVEHVYHSNPCGLHQVYAMPQYTTITIAQWLKNLPGSG